MGRRSRTPRGSAWACFRPLIISAWLRCERTLPGLLPLLCQSRAVGPETPASKVIEDILAHKVHLPFVVGTDGVWVGTIRTVDVLRHLRPGEPAKDAHRGANAETVPRSLGYEPW